VDTPERVRALAAPLVEAAGAGLYDVEFTGGVLRITLEKEGGVDIGLIGRVTRDVSRALDEADPIAGQYTLEVSSPGLERPLRRPEHFAGAVGSLVALKTKPGVEGERRVKGVLVAVDADRITVAPADAEPGITRELGIDDLERARTVFEWGPAPKPGTGSKPGAPAKTKTQTKTKAKASGPAKTSPSSKKKAAKS
jgi:ribosome maturation factor RimP